MTEPFADKILRTIRRDVDRLTLTTYAGARRGTTLPALLDELRSRATRTTPASALYDELTDTISVLYSGATGLDPTGTPEQMLLTWLTELDLDHRASNTTELLLLTQGQKIHSIRTRIEQLLPHPRGGRP